MAEVFNRFADEYSKHRLLSFEQQKLIRDIRQCRTYVLGGHVTACTACGNIKVHYNSCGNRGCPPLLRRSGYAKAKSARE
jgi:hypothetical protein